MITLSTSTMKGTNDVFRRLEIIKGLEIDAVELGAMHDPVNDLPRLYKVIADYGRDFIVHCFFPPAKKPFMVNIAAKPGTLLKDSFRQIRESLEFCAKSEAKLYTIHPGALNSSDEDDTKDAAFSRFLQNFGYVQDLAKDYDIPIAVENSNAASRHFFYGPEYIQKAVSEYPKMRLLVDIGHLKLASIDAGFDIKTFIDRFQGRVLELHLHHNDGTYDQHLPLEDDKILSMFSKDVLRSNYLTLEGQKNWDENQVRDSIAFLRKMI
jgi:sugar phosphate isomerase/epimerase